MNATAPIYILIDGKENGPHTVDDIDALLAENEIALGNFSCVEGMPGWRTIPETLVWSYSKLAGSFRSEAEELINRLANRDLEIREARLEIYDQIERANILRVHGAVDQLAVWFDVNASLLRTHRKFRADHQNWDAAVLDSFPAAELLAFGELKFQRDWKSVWQDAGGTISGDRMIARKDSPVWRAISDFGFPFPPFSMDVMMWVMDVDFAEAEQLGILTLHDEVRFPANLKPFSLIGVL